MIIDRFEEQVKKYPNQIAVKTVNDVLTYQELNNYANAVAWGLIDKCDSIEFADRETAALLFEHGTDMIAGKFGTLKAAKVYVPMDPNYPLQLLTYMLEDCDATLIITNDRNVELANKLIQASKSKAEIINISKIKKTSVWENINPKCDGNHLAYILYTSGSTGKPKGVMQSHENVLHFAECYRNVIEITSDDKMTLLSSFSHDGGIGDIYGALLNGASLYPLDVKSNMTMNGIADWLKMERISIWHSVPTLYRHFVNMIHENDDFPSLRFVIVGGESVLLHDVNKCQKIFPSAKFAIFYGQSESSINSVQIYTADCKVEEITLGESVEGTEIVVVDENREEVLPLDVGEIVVLSNYVALGYWKDELKSKELFRDIPEVGRTYWTGDLGRLLEDGHIEIIGRKDFQVKIRGFRIELSGIENQLIALNEVKEAVVTACEGDADEKYLCAYIVSDEDILASELRYRLSDSLPEYMIPTYFVRMDKLPLTPSGKVNRKALPKPSGDTNSAYVAPRNMVEEMLVRIWKEVLNKERISIYDDFFELGGHSLKGIVLISKIHKELNVEVPLKELFRRSTVAGLSEYITLAPESVYKEIEPVVEKEYYEVSSAQKRMWLLQQLDPESTSYNMSGVFILDGDLNRSLLEKTISSLIERHELFRTTFEIVENTLVQRVAKSVEFKIEFIENKVNFAEGLTVRTDCSPTSTVGANRSQAGTVGTSCSQAHKAPVATSCSMDSKDFNYGLAREDALGSKSENIEETIKAFIRPFDLSKAPFLRVGLIKTSETRYYLLFDMHHIISDGVSMSILTKEFMSLYDGQKLAEQRIQYKDFSEWQNEYLKSAAMKEQEKYWLEQFSGEIPLLNMPLDYMRPPIQSFAGGRVEFKLNQEMTKELNNLARISGATLYMILLSAINIVLSKYTGQADIIVGSPISGRGHADLADIIGMFINTLAMRNYPESGKTYAEFLKEVKETALKAYENQNYQFEELVEKMELQRDMSRSPLFDVMFVLQNMEIRKLEIEGLKLTEYNTDQTQAKFDLTFIAIESDGEILFKIEYATSLFKRETIERLSIHFQTLIEVITAQRDILLKNIDITSKNEREKILYEFNNTHTDYLIDKTVVEVFEIQVRKTPTQTAVVCEDKKLTYQELNERANALAFRLRALDVKPNDYVGLMMGRSLEVIIGMLGILKAGGAFVPLDPMYPEERLSCILADCRSKVLLTDQELTIAMPMIKLKEFNEKRIANLEAVNQPDDLIYAIYTSGTTGRPKGVMIEHQNVLNLVNWQKAKGNYTETSVILQILNYNFDASIQEIFPALLSGCTLEVIPETSRYNPEKLLPLIAGKQVFMIPSLFKSLVDYAYEFDLIPQLHAFDKLYLGGEATPVDLLKSYRQLPGSRLGEIFNLYGPTEATVCATSYRFNQNHDRILIGKPIDNTQIYILNGDNLCAIGIVGELCIGGAGVARGYLHYQELTAEKFVSNPFIEDGRMYRTGDLARWVPDGNIEFLGRIDHQVKIRGFRIELGEIESQLLKINAVKEAIVLDKEDEARDKYLCAYLVSKEEIAIQELRRQLSDNLPDYMIPSYFVWLESIPLTPNGKLDRKVLPEPDGKTGVEYVPPRNAREESLVRIWSEVLGKEKVGVYDNFFELGGHSLKATVLASRIHKELNVELQLKDIFKTSTIAGLSKCIADLDKSDYQMIEAVETKEHYEASYTQKRIWVINQLNPNSTMFNMPGRITFNEEINETILEEIFDKLIERHEAFRTRFEKLKGTLVQIIDKKSDFLMDKMDLSILSFEEREQERIRVYEKLIAKIFDLKGEHLINAKLIKVSEKEYELIFCVHHIISDGWSMDLLKKEFFMLYEASKHQQELELTPLRIQYKDFAQWQNQLIESKKFAESAKAFWANQLSGEVPTLSFPADYQAFDAKSKTRGTFKTVLDENTKGDLQRLTRQFHTSLFILLITTFITFLSELTGQDDILIGLPTLGRGHVDLHSVIGCFVNTTILRNKINNNEKFIKLMRNIEENTLNALEYQDYPLELVIDELNIKYPQISAFFNMLNFGESANDYMTDLNSPQTVKAQDIKFDLEWNVIEYLNAVQITCVYNAELFEPETIEYIMNSYTDYVIKVSENPNGLLKEYFTEDDQEF